jgi:hypothetical protein
LLSNALVNVIEKAYGGVTVAIAISVPSLCLTKVTAVREYEPKLSNVCF